MRGVVVYKISSLMFYILDFMACSSCLKSSINRWYYCRSLSASLVRFYMIKDVPLQLRDGLWHELNSGYLSRGTRSCSLTIKYIT